MLPAFSLVPNGGINPRVEPSAGILDGARAWVTASLAAQFRILELTVEAGFANLCGSKSKLGA